MNFINFNFLDNHPFFKEAQIHSMINSLLDELKISFSSCELIKRDSLSYDLLFDNSFDYISKIELDLVNKTPIVSFKSNILLESDFKNFIDLFTKKIDIILHNKSVSTFYIATTINIHNEINYTVCIFSGNCTFISYITKTDFINKNYFKLKESFSKTKICKKLYPDYTSDEIVENFDSIATLISIVNI